MNTTKIGLFYIYIDDVNRIMKQNNIDISSIIVSSCSNRLCTEIEIMSETDKNAVSDILSVLKPYIYSIEGKSIFEVLAEYLVVFDKTLILVEQGTAGYLSSSISLSTQKQVIRKSIIITDLTIENNEFDLPSEAMNPSNQISSANAYNIATKVLSENVCDYLIVTLAELRKNNDTNLGSIERYGSTYIALATERETVVKNFHFGGSKQDIAISEAQMAAWLLLKKIKLGE